MANLSPSHALQPRPQRPGQAIPRHGADTAPRRATLGMALLCLLAAGLAGCLGGGKDDVGVFPSPTPAAPGQGNATLQAPQWELGDWWNFTYTGPSGGDGPAGARVVTEDLGADWRMETDNQATAFLDARYDISSLGPQRKSDLAGSQGDERVLFFQWPLVDGASWTTPWDGTPKTVTASARPDGSFAFVALNQTGGLYATYTYEPAVAWFGEISFFDDDGTVQFGLVLQDHGSRFTGEIDRWRLEQVTDWEGDLSGGHATNFVVEPTVTDVYVEFELACSAGAYAAGVGALAGQGAGTGMAQQGPCPAQVAQLGPVGSPGLGQDEAWGAFINAAPAASIGQFHFFVFKRTHETAQLS